MLISTSIEDIIEINFNIKTIPFGQLKCLKINIQQLKLRFSTDIILTVGLDVSTQINCIAFCYYKWINPLTLKL